MDENEAVSQTICIKSAVVFNGHDWGIYIPKQVHYDVNVRPGQSDNSVVCVKSPTVNIAIEGIQENFVLVMTSMMNYMFLLNFRLAVMRTQISKMR